ncbi:MAG: lipoyl(octanoyl) transferase LipB [Mariprofundaceae bacterium]|nr:lipoyl(octanoyl) transferase LipB [Mariprofundaceae bacterium]
MLNIIRQSENLPAPTFVWLGEQEYTAFLEKMQLHSQQLMQGQKHEVVYFCEHQPVFTTGKRGINNSKVELGAPLIHTERGGETTFHGTGQLMMYPLIQLKRYGLSVRSYVHLLEQSCLDLLQTHQIHAARDCGLPGVWLNQEKIAALGIRINQGFTSHGMALNVHTDLTWFDKINPCGTSRKTTTMQKQGLKAFDLTEIAQQWFHIFNVLLTAQMKKNKSVHQV